MKLIMTLLVRDEEDVIEDNICFHLNNGVDHIVVIDNGSIDGTTDVLDKYSKKGILNYRIVKEHTYEQDKWVSSMAEEAIDNLGATHLIHCDADEMWFPNNGSLRETIRDMVGVNYVNVLNYLPPERDEGEGIAAMNLMVVKPLKYPKTLLKMYSDKFLLYEYAPKVITTREYRKIGYGNHEIKRGSGGLNEEKIIRNDIFIHHFPIRSFEHFKCKVINGGTAYEKNPLNDPNIGWHWKAWYKIYKAGNLIDEYNKLCLKGKTDRYLVKGLIKRVSVPKKIRWAKQIRNIKNLIG
ncbi:MAG: glycosyltransferase family 2 protein [Candidatus Shapirobacteria bacterium]